MIGLLLIPAFVIWLIASVILSSKIPDWLGIKKHATVWTLFLFTLVLILPMADEFIGRWQFHRLCEKEAVIWLGPDWMNVRKAISVDAPVKELNGYFFIPIKIQVDEYKDKETGKVFLVSKSFHTKGGLLMRLGLGMGGTSSCWPPNDNDVYREINLENLTGGK